MTMSLKQEQPGILYLAEGWTLGPNMYVEPYDKIGILISSRNLS
jgi:hypothetical protein